MAKIEITRTDLVRPGKYKEDKMLKEVRRVNLSFEFIERVNMSAPRLLPADPGLQLPPTSIAPEVLYPMPHALLVLSLSKDALCSFGTPKVLGESMKADNSRPAP